MAFKVLLICLLISSCSSAGRKDRDELRTLYLTGAYDNGLQLLSKSEFYLSEKEKLLTLMEKGMLLHSKGDWKQSTVALDEARNLSNKLYTISISKKAEKNFVNDTVDVFYGEVYERSMLYFYLSLNAILTYQQSKNRDDLFRARAEILAWDAFLASIKEERLGKSVFKNDLLLKLYGAKIHQMMGTREDEQIATILLSDAKNIIYKNYNSYPTFNGLYKEFKKDYEKLATLPASEVQKNYIAPTDFQKSLMSYIDQSLEAIKSPKKKDSKKTRVTLVLQKGVIAQKIAEKNFYGLDFLAKEPLVSLFVADVLGLLPTANTYNPGGAYLGLVVASTALNTVGVGFELPKIQNFSQPKKIYLSVIDKDKKEIASKELPLVDPMGDIAEEAVFEQSAWTYTRVGTRLAIKHASAILASFATYKALGGKQQNDFFARNAALLQYIGASKVIEESEKADTRYWSTLPNELRMIDLDLAPGNYSLVLKLESSEKMELGTIQITSQEMPYIVSIRKN